MENNHVRYILIGIRRKIYCFFGNKKHKKMASLAWNVFTTAVRNKVDFHLDFSSTKNNFRSCVFVS